MFGLFSNSISNDDILEISRMLNNFSDGDYHNMNTRTGFRNGKLTIAYKLTDMPNYYYYYIDYDGINVYLYCDLINRYDGWKQYVPSECKRKIKIKMKELLSLAKRKRLEREQGRRDGEQFIDNRLRSALDNACR